MQKIIKIIIAGLFFPTWLFAQLDPSNKYALLLGLNDYYVQPGVKHGSSLHGCVNDANSIRGLLVNRFGFTTANIQMLYNENVTRKNVIDQMHVILQKCKPGDAFVFFYSGHGAWMSNPMNKFDSVKRGMSQSMVMSDLYSPNLDCLLTDEVLKTVFNEFVDKKVIVTALFDCCYSGNLSMGFSTEYWMPLLRPVTKGIMLNSIRYVPEKIKPKGCITTSAGLIVDTADTDHDGVPDCMDWEIDSPPFVSVDSLGVSKGEIFAEDFVHLSEEFNAIHSDSTDRSFNMKDALKVWYPLRAKRPSDRFSSKFISISAASDVEKGNEMTDENGLKHGAFTKALLTVYQNNPSDLPLSELVKKIGQLLKQEGYYQTPTYHNDPVRIKGNLIGTNSSQFSNTITATCMAAKNGVIILDKGLSADVGRGNIFKDVTIPGNKTVTITQAFYDSAVAVDKTELIKPGHKLELIDHYTASNPIVNIFIPTMNCSVAGFASFFRTRIKPIVDSSSYSDFGFPNYFNMNRVTLCYDENNYTQFTNPSFNGGPDGVNNFVLLPVPSYIVNGLKTFSAKDQNIGFVTDAAKADYVLYINYVKAKADHPASFVFYFHPRVDDPANFNISIFCQEYLEIPSVNLTSKNLQAFSKKLYDLMKKTLRYKTNAWINIYPRR